MPAPLCADVGITMVSVLAATGAALKALDFIILTSSMLPSKNELAASVPILKTPAKVSIDAS